MATRYAVASGNWSNTTSVWSDTDGGAPGSFVPVDGDTFVIRAGVNVLMDVNQSAWTGLAGSNVIRGGATPGMLYWANGTDGVLKFRSTAVLTGTVDTYAGRLLANSNGTWGNTTPLQQSNTATIMLEGTTTPATINAVNLDIALHATHPQNWYVPVYNRRELDSGQWFTFDATSDISEADDTITLDFDPPADGDTIMFRATSGSLPGGLLADTLYFVRNRNTTNNTLKVGRIPGGSDTVQLTQAAGTCEMYAEFAAADVNGDGRGGAGAYATFDVLTDLTSDTQWAAGARVILVDELEGGTSTVDQQRGIISTSFPTSSQIRVAFKSTGGTCDSAQRVFPRLYLIDRNVSIYTSGTTEATSYAVFGGGSGTAGHTLYIDCAFINTAGFNATNQTTCEGVGVYYYSGSLTFSGIAACFSEVLNMVGGSLFTRSAITGMMVGNGTCVSNPSGLGVTLSGIFSGNTNTISGGSGHNIISGQIRGGVNAFYGCSGYFEVTRNAIIYGCGNVVSGSAPGGTFSCMGTLIYNYYIVYANSAGFALGGSIQSTRGNGITECNHFKLYSAEFLYHSSSNQIQQSASFDAYNSNITTYYAAPGINGSGFRSMGRSFNHGGVANDTRCFTPYGTMTHETSTVPSGKSYSHKFTYTSWMQPVLMEWEITRPTLYGAISITVYAKHDQTSLTESQRIHWALVDLSADPWADSVNFSYLDLFIAADSTSWQSHTLTYTKVDDRPVVLRVWATRGSGNAYVYCDPAKLGRRPVPG